MMEKRKMIEPLEYEGFDGYEELCQAIVKQAAIDYRRCAQIIKTSHDKKKVEDARYEMDSIEHFFLGEDIRMFTKADGSYILDRLEEECGMVERKIG